MNIRFEQNILIISACGAFFFAVLALIWGTITGSQMIMFDGVYSFLSLMMTGLYYYAAKNIMLGRSESFPYGRTQIEPLVVVAQSIFLLGICIRAFITSTISLFSTVPEMNNLSGMVYAAIGTFGCFIWWSYIKNSGRKKAPESQLLKTQAGQWLMDTLFSLSVLVGFTIGYILELLGYADYAAYMDPLMVTVAVLFFVRQPVVALVDSVKRILIMAPENEVIEISREALKEIAQARGFEDVVLRIGKAGRELVYEIGLVSKDAAQTCSACEMDSIHREIKKRLGELFDNPLWVNVSFGYDREEL